MTYRVLAVRPYMFATRGFVRHPTLGPRSFPIGRGHSFADLPDFLVAEVGAKGAIERISTANRTGERISQIWPPYQTVVLYKEERFVIATAVTEAEDLAARALLANVHPERAAAHGLLVCLYALAANGVRDLVGVAQIGEYYHARPCGREAFSRRMNGPRFRQLRQGEEIKAIPIASAKRFAIAEHRQGEGLGGILGRQAKKVARNYRWPSARVLEVLRYQRARNFLAICCETKRDFLTRSGYVPVPRSEWIRNGQIFISSAAIPAYRTVPGYYYADLTETDRPRFVADARAEIAGSAVRAAGD